MTHPLVNFILLLLFFELGDGLFVPFRVNLPGDVIFSNFVSCFPVW